MLILEAISVSHMLSRAQLYINDSASRVTYLNTSSFALYLLPWLLRTFVLRTAEHENNRCVTHNQHISLMSIADADIFQLSILVGVMKPWPLLRLLRHPLQLWSRVSALRLPIPKKSDLQRPLIRWLQKRLLDLLPYSAYSGLSQTGVLMPAYSLPVLPVRLFFRALAVRFISVSSCTVSDTITGFFTLLVGRFFHVESLTVAKVISVVLRQFPF